MVFVDWHLQLSVENALEAEARDYLACPGSAGDVDRLYKAVAGTRLWRRLNNRLHARGQAEACSTGEDKLKLH